MNRSRQEDGETVSNRQIGYGLVFCSVKRGDALRILERSGTVRYVELLQTERQKALAARRFSLQGIK